jgi:hypothetical protein
LLAHIFFHEPVHPNTALTTAESLRRIASLGNRLSDVRKSRTIGGKSGCRRDLLRSFRTPISFLFCAFVVTPVVLFLELALRLPPLVEVLVEIVTVTATFDVNLKRSPTDFVQGWHVLAPFFPNVRPETAWPRVLSIRGQILRLHVPFSFPKRSV